jgi:hypothetical protein
LISININPKEAQYYLNIIAQRLAKNFTGARWQINTFEHLTQKMHKDKACQLLVQRYIKNCKSGQPVALWE